MRLRLALCVVLMVVPWTARADGPYPLIPFIQSLTSGAGARPRTRVQPAASAKAQAAPAAGNTVTVVSDVEIGSAGNIYVGTAVWRRDGQLAWQDAVTNGIWYCTLNPATGELIPPDGKGQFIGTAATFAGDLSTLLTGRRATLNGPEWGNSQEGVGVYFTVTDLNGIYQQSKCLLANAPNFRVEQFTAGGQFDRYSNLSSQDGNDANARVLYYEAPVGQPQTLYQPAFWKLDLLTQQDSLVPLDVFSFNGPRWVPGQHALTTFVKDVNGITQVAKYNTDTAALTFLTTGPQAHAEAEIVIDPSTGLATWMTCVEDNTAIAVYQLQAGKWVKTNTIVPRVKPVLFPAPGNVFALKPFVVGGKLYFFYNVFIGDQTWEIINPIDIYIGSADGSINQSLTNGSYFDYAINPQYYIGTTGNQVYLYYYTSLPLPYIINYSKFHRLTFTIN